MLYDILGLLLIDQDLEKHLIPITIYQPIFAKKNLIEYLISSNNDFKLNNALSLKKLIRMLVSLFSLIRLFQPNSLREFSEI